MDRKKTPWIIVYGHRPFYCSSVSECFVSVGRERRQGKTRRQDEAKKGQERGCKDAVKRQGRSRWRYGAGAEEEEVREME